MTKRKRYTKEFKLDAVRLVTEHGYSRTEAGRNLGINANMKKAGVNRPKRHVGNGPNHVPSRDNQTCNGNEAKRQNDWSYRKLVLEYQNPNQCNRNRDDRDISGFLHHSLCPQASSTLSDYI